MAKTKVKTVYKIKWKNFGIMFFVLALLGCLVWGSIYGIKFIKDYSSAKEIIEKIKSDVKIESIVDDEFTSTPKQPSTLSKFDIYWDYVKLGLIDVDMSNLKRMNADSIGYMEIKGTSFAYPIVKGEKDFYKKHSFDKKKNSLGWIYVDEDTSIEELATNTIIYGNKVLGSQLMGSTNEIFKSSWNEDKNNFIIRYSTSYYSTLWQIISVYHTTENTYNKKEFENEDEVQKYADSIISKSEIRFKASAVPTDKFLTIATNSNGTNTIIHAKLIKIREEQ